MKLQQYRYSEYFFFQGSDSDDCVNEDALDPEATTPKEIASDKVWMTVMTVKYTMVLSVYVFVHCSTISNNTLNGSFATNLHNLETVTLIIITVNINAHEYYETTEIHI